jgi:TrmH family RNA methyltransferase
VTSRSNAGVKRILGLHDRRERTRTGLCWLESRNCVHAALERGAALEEVALSTAAQPDARALALSAAARGVRVTEYDAGCFTKFSALRHPDGIGAVVVAPVPCAAEQVELPSVVLWQLQDPGNAGSIVRSAAALGCRTVVNVQPAVDLLHPLCLRATAGTLFRITRAELPADKAEQWLLAHSSEVVVLSMDGDELGAEGAGLPAGILVLGSEAHGVPRAVRVRHRAVAIPMRAGVESLNVNAAAAIAMYAFWGRRGTPISHDADTALPRTSA